MHNYSISGAMQMVKNYFINGLFTITSSLFDHFQIPPSVIIHNFCPTALMTSSLTDPSPPFKFNF